MSDHDPASSSTASLYQVSFKFAASPCHPGSREMYNVPVELLYAIVDEVEETSDLVALRLVSKTIRSIATPKAFRVLTLNDSGTDIRSSWAFCFLQTCDESITSVVREVVFEGDASKRRHYRCEEKKGRRTALKMAISGLSKFPNLEHLRFEFHGSFQQHSVPTPRGHRRPGHFLYYLRLQFDLLTALAASPPPSLISLTLNNLIAMPHEIYEKESFHRIFRSLNTLRISVRCHLEDSDDFLQMDERLTSQVSTFWDASIYNTINSCVALRSLALHSDLPVGADRYPTLSLAGIYLPNLTSLSLHNFVFPVDLNSPERDVEEFILRHGATLMQLVLHGSSMVGEDSVVPRPWYALLKRFAKGLGALQHFELNGADRSLIKAILPDAVRNPAFHYHVLTGDDDEYMERGYVPGEELDVDALEGLLATVEKRRSRLQTE
ncbi:hypothetical protein B0H11DRAFT_1928423 [Mycena galericulata]|nr:hypothetical protein B0H11DRAFT_1928423 [Mycena galericulata]